MAYYHDTKEASKSLLFLELRSEDLVVRFIELTATNECAESTFIKPK